MNKKRHESIRKRKLAVNKQSTQTNNIKVFVMANNSFFF